MAEHKAVFFSTVHEYALFYAKDIEKVEENFRFKTEDVEEEESFIRGREDATPETRPSLYYSIFYNPETKEITLDNKGDDFIELLPENKNGMRTWKLVKESFLEELKEGKIEVRKARNKYEIYRKIVREKNKAKTMWTDAKYDANHHGTGLLKKLFDGQNLFSYPKSLYTLLDILKLTMNEDDIVLDFFAGSGTTGHAVFELNKQDGGKRQFILVEQLEEHITVCKERLEKVITQEGILSGDFIYCELMQYNQAYMDKIQAAQSCEELVSLWQEIAENSFLNWYVNAEMPQDAVQDFIDIDEVATQKHLLVELLDKNQLYVHLSEIEDVDFDVSDDDKVLNEKFYGK